MVRFFFLSACVCALEACGGEHVSTGPFEPGRYLTTATFAPVAGDSPVCDSNAASAAPLAAACCPAVEQSTRKLAHDANGYAFTSDDSVASPPFAATLNDNVLMWKEFSNLMAADIDPCADYPVKAYVWQAGQTVTFTVTSSTAQGCERPSSRRCTYAGTNVRQP